MGTLFKDRVQRESCASLLELLRGDQDQCRKELLGSVDPKTYSGKFEPGQHNRCDGLKEEEKPSQGKEKRVCKCLYYFNSGLPTVCDPGKCVYAGRKRRVVGHYSIKDYEVPCRYTVRGSGIGNIDLLLEGPGEDGASTLYATEVKPPEGNPESLLRMIAEIITYTLDGFTYGGKKARRAIAFFEGSDQDREYAAQGETQVLKDLLKEAEISVFCFREEREGAYRICRL